LIPPLALKGPTAGSRSPPAMASCPAGRFEELRLRVESYPWGEVAPGLAVTISIGAARLRPGRRTQAALLGQADRYLYAAKNTGRNRVVVGAD
jgi:PleD family two-component response regulator